MGGVNFDCARRGNRVGRKIFWKMSMTPGGKSERRRGVVGKDKSSNGAVNSTRGEGRKKRRIELCLSFWPGLKVQQQVV